MFKKVFCRSETSSVESTWFGCSCRAFVTEVCDSWKSPMRNDIRAELNNGSNRKLDASQLLISMDWCEVGFNREYGEEELNGTGANGLQGGLNTRKL